MAKAMDLLRKLRALQTTKADGTTAFDARMKKLATVRQVSVARAVLFRTQPARLEA